MNEVTSDHVIARSWYPDSTPENIERLQVPACRPCNHSYSSLEEDFLLRTALCIDQSHPAATGIVERVLRSVDPRHGKSTRDRRIRRKRHEKLMRDIAPIDALPRDSCVPFTRKNLAIGATMGLPMPKELDRVVEKCVRGLHFLLLGERIGADVNVHVRHVSDEAAREAFQEIIQYATALERGPGITVLQWVVTERGLRASIYAFEIWSQARFYAHVGEVL